MKNLDFNTEQPQEWLKGVHNAFTLWIRNSEKEGDRIRFNKDYLFTIPKSKNNQEEITYPIKAGIIYTSKDLNSIYMVISKAVREYMNS